MARKDLKSAREAVVDALAQLHETDAALRRDHAAAIKEHRNVATTLPPVDEIVASMREVVTRKANGWLERQGRTVVRAFCTRDEFNHNGAGAILRTYKPGLPELHSIGAPSLSLEDLCGLAPELVMQGFEKAIRATNVSTGLTAAERDRQLAKLTARITEIENEHTELVEEAAAFTPPVVIQLLPAVKARREAEESRARNGATSRQRRQDLERRVNA